MTGLSSINKKAIIAGVLILVVLGGIFLGPSVARILGVGFGLPTPNILQATDPGGTYQLGGQSNQWTYLSKTYTYTGHQNTLYGADAQHLQLCADAKVAITVQVTALAGPTNITNQTVIFKVAQNAQRNTTVYQSTNYQVYSYSFKVNTGWTGTFSFYECGVGWYHNDALCILSFGKCLSQTDMASQVVQRIIAQINNEVYETAATIQLDLNAPTLANKALPTPGYVGVMGLYLQDYQYGGYTGGTAAQMLPNNVGTPVAIYLDNSFSNQAFALATPAPLNYTAPAQLVYYPQNFAAQYAYWKIQIVTLGSTISFQSVNRDYPNYWVWAYQTSNLGNFPSTGSQACLLPCVAQWFRVDVLQLTNTPFEIPNYKLPQDQRDKQSIVVPSAPTNPATPSPPQASATQQLYNLLLSIWTAFWYIVIAVIIILVLVVAIRIGRGPSPSVNVGVRR